MSRFAILTFLALLAHAMVAPDTGFHPDAQAFLPDAPTATPLIAIQPLGGPDTTLVRFVASEVRATFDADVVVLPDRPLPADAYYARRRRYRGDRIIDDLDVQTPLEVTKVIALTSRDISKTKGAVYDWGVIGLASLGGRAAVVSTHRLGRCQVPPGRFATRLARVVEHEIGHTFGLRHCETPGCLMNDACGSIATVDRSSGAFCDGCQDRLGDVLREPLAPETAAVPHSGAGEGVDGVTASMPMRTHAARFPRRFPTR